MQYLGEYKEWEGSERYYEAKYKSWEEEYGRN